MGPKIKSRNYAIDCRPENQDKFIPGLCQQSVADGVRPIRKSFVYTGLIACIRLFSFDLKFGADASVDFVQLKSTVKAFRGVATPDMAAVQQEVSLSVFHKEAVAS